MVWDRGFNDIQQCTLQNAVSRTLAFTPFKRAQEWGDKKFFEETYQINSFSLSRGPL